MHKFLKTKDPENRFDISDVALQSDNQVTIDDLNEMYERYLLACGFCFKGHVRIIEEDEE